MTAHRTRRLLLAVLLLTFTISQAGFASDVRPSIEITGGDTTGICDNADGSLNPQIATIVNRSVDSSTLGQLYVAGAGMVDSSLETDPFGFPVFAGSFGFGPSTYIVGTGTRVTSRMTTFHGPDGADGVSYVGEVVFTCDTGAVFSLVNLEALYFDGFESTSTAFWSNVVSP